MTPDKMKERYNFFLNPYSDCAFSRCPKCENATKLKKLPLTIAIRKEMILNLNKTCRFCPYCNLLIARKKEIEGILFEKFGEKLSEKEYFIMGTIEKSDYFEGVAMAGSHFFDRVFVFKNVWDFQSAKPMWVKDKEREEDG